MDLTQGISGGELALLNHASGNRLPANGSIELSPICNMNCDMCYVRLTPEELSTQGRLRTWQEWIEIGKQMKDAGVLFLLLTGGEPLLYPGFKELYLELRSMGMILTVNTNGTMLDEEWADFFAQNKPRRINITLYGGSEETYEKLCHYRGYERTLNAVKLLRERSVDVRLGISVAADNADDVEEIRKIASKLEVPLNVDTYMMPATRERTRQFNQSSRMTPERAAEIRYASFCELHPDPEERRQVAAELLSIVEKDSLEERQDHVEVEGPGMKCMAGKCSFSVNWQGQLHPCVILTEPTADVFEVGFSRAWEIITKGTDQIRLSAGCAKCEMRSLCHTCAACALLEAGSYTGKPEYMCRYTEKYIELLKREL